MTVKLVGPEVFDKAPLIRPLERRNLVGAQKERCTLITIVWKPVENC